MDEGAEEAPRVEMAYGFAEYPRRPEGSSGTAGLLGAADACPGRVGEDA